VKYISLKGYTVKFRERSFSSKRILSSRKKPSCSKIKSLLARKRVGPASPIKPRQYSILSKFPRLATLRRCISLSLSLSSSLIGHRRENTEIVYLRRDFGRRPNGARWEKAEREGKWTGERNDRKYERELRVTAENGGLCVFNPPRSARPSSSPQLSSLPLAPPPPQRSPSRKRASESPRVMFEHEK